jgi:hypothetical protein
VFGAQNGRAYEGRRHGGVTSSRTIHHYGDAQSAPLGHCLPTTFWCRASAGEASIVPPSRQVHTYSGTCGAQAALVLRRWRHLLDALVRWVGLSATLRDAPAFFGDLTGLTSDIVAEVTPAADDMEFSGAEYQLVLRSDPSSQAATLSTSIQAAMLVARMLDPVTSGPSQAGSDGAYRLHRRSRCHA